MADMFTDLEAAIRRARLRRRDFLKGGLGVLGAAFLAACGAAVSSITGSPAASPSGSAGASAGKPFAGSKIAGIMQDAPTPGNLYQTVFAPEWGSASGGDVAISLVDYDSLYQKLILDATSNTAENDFFGLDILWTGQFAVSEFAVKLNDRLASDSDLSSNINKVLLQGVTWKDDLVALPATNQSWNLFYRKDVFDKKGMKPPENWDDFLRIAKELTADWDDDGKPNYGVAMNVKRGPFIIHDWMGYFAAMGGQAFENWPDVRTTTWRPQFNSDPGVKALELYQEMNKYAPPDVAEYDWNKTQGALDSGLVAMVCSWNDGVGSRVFQSSSPVYGKIGWARLPNAAGVKRFDARGYWSIGINPDSKNQDAVWDFLKFALSKQAQTELVQKYPGLAPGRDDLLQELATSDGPNSFLHFIQELNQNNNPMNFAWRPTIPEWSNIQDIFGLLLNQAMTGQMTAKAALDAGNKQLTDVMHNAGYF